MFNYSFGRRIFSVAVIFCFGIFACPPSSVLGVQEEAAKSDFKSTEVSLTAGDGFPISAMWYEGDKKKAASALILLHELKRDRRDFADLAAYFAKNGHCVIVPDLRGHGKSTVTANGGEYIADRIGKSELLSMQADIEACKKFLIKKNDEEICNIELLMVVADGATSIPALGWCIVDWSFLPTAVKQGQDVKGLVMLSPLRSYQGSQINPALRLPLISGKGAPNPLDIMLVAGSKSRQFRDSKSIYSMLSTSRGRRDEQDDWEKHDVFLVTTPTADVGVEILSNNAETVPSKIFDFLEFRILKNAEEYVWRTRSTTKE